MPHSWHAAQPLRQDARAVIRMPRAMSMVGRLFIALLSCWASLRHHSASTASPAAAGSVSWSGRERWKPWQALALTAAPAPERPRGGPARREGRIFHACPSLRSRTRGVNRPQGAVAGEGRGGSSPGARVGVQRCGGYRPLDKGLGVAGLRLTSGGEVSGLSGPLNEHVRVRGEAQVRGRVLGLWGRHYAQMSGKVPAARRLHPTE